MAYSKCPKCDYTSFELVINEPKNSDFKLAFVQCGSCGCVVGTMDYWNIGTKIIDLDKKMDSLSSTASSLSGNLNTINQNIAKLFNLVSSLKK